MRRRSNQAGVTLVELLVAVTLVAVIALALLLALRIGMNALEKVNAKLDSNRRVTGVERILEQDLANIIPVAGECQTEAGLGGGGGPKFSFFEGELQSMRFVTSYSLEEAQRGIPRILELRVAPREEGGGVRLLANEYPYTGPFGTRRFCTGMGPRPDAPGFWPLFPPIHVGVGSFVMADKLSMCRFNYKYAPITGDKPKWEVPWLHQDALPRAIRVEMMPLEPGSGRLEPLTLTVPLRIERSPLFQYVQ